MATGRLTPYLTHPKNRKLTDRLWERFHTGDLPEEASLDPYARTLLDDWRRCRARGVDPTMEHALALPPDDFRRLTEEKSLVLDKARRAFDRVVDVLAGIPGILIFTDEDGTILHVAGDPRIRVKAADTINLMEGGLWSEAKAGTNGIGTAAAKGAPVHVYASEHFCQAWHPWTCAGAPVTFPFGDKLVGVVDFTSLETDFRASAPALAYSLAATIAGELRLQIEMERLQLLHHYAELCARYPSERVLVFDRMGQLVRGAEGVDPEVYRHTGERCSAAAAPPKEVRPVTVPGSREPIGTLVVVPRPRGVVARPAPGADSGEERVAFGAFVTANRRVKEMLARLEKVIPTDLTVLLVGETGTGKELLASYIHTRGPRRSGPFVAVNCGAISPELFESRFFGYERGAFTGADPRGRKGLLETADGGTLFLDEIGEMPLDLQVALLRVLETGRFRRLGSDRERTSDCRVIAATNRPLDEDIQRGTFRPDLYYRLAAVKACLPPLRERPEDVPLLAEHFAHGFCARHGLPPKSFAPEAMAVLTAHRWPGNARELRNAVEAAVVCAGDRITVEDLPPELLAEVPQAAGRHGLEEAAGPSMSPADPGAELSVRDSERRLILTALRKYRKVSLAARALGMSRSTLYRRFDALGINPREAAARSPTRGAPSAHPGPRV
ncbi:MAG: sigma-54-dependent Fis family transcriptional regulator [Deferrisomatales bacterium]